MEEKINNTSPESSKIESKFSKHKKLVILIIVTILIIDVGLFAYWKKLNFKTLETDSVFVARIKSDPIKEEKTIINVIKNNNNELSEGWSRTKLIYLYIRHLTCEMEKEDNDDYFYNVGIKFINQPLLEEYETYEIFPWIQEHVVGLMKNQLDTAKERSDKKINQNEFMDQTFIEAILDYSVPLIEKCPQLTIECRDNNFWRNEPFSMPDSFCNEICSKITEYDTNKELLHEELVKNNFKGWESQDWLPNYPLLRYVVLNRLGNRDMILEVEKYELPDYFNRIFVRWDTFLDTFGTGGMACDKVRSELGFYVDKNL